MQSLHDCIYIKMFHFVQINFLCWHKSQTTITHLILCDESLSPTTTTIHTSLIVKSCLISIQKMSLHCNYWLQILACSVLCAVNMVKAVCPYLYTFFLANYSSCMLGAAPVKTECNVDTVIKSSQGLHYAFY